MRINYLVAALLWLAGILFLSITKSLNYAQPALWLEKQFGNDLAMHDVLAGVLAFFSAKHSRVMAEVVLEDCSVLCCLF